jgi:uncharacterized protein
MCGFESHLRYHFFYQVQLLAEVAKLVDAHVSGACVLRREGSSPSFGTSQILEQGSGFFYAYKSPAMHSFIGIDFGSKLAGTSVIAWVQEGNFHFLQSQAKKDADLMLLTWIQEQKPAQVFIDAPLSLPIVYRNPETGSDFHYRQADRESQAMSPMFLGGLTARAMRLQHQCQASDIPFYEVYPGKLAQILGLPGLGYKKEHSAIPNCLEVLGPQLPYPAPTNIDNWHIFDALLAWCTGWRFSQSLHLSFGNLEEGLIFV